MEHGARFSSTFSFEEPLGELPLRSALLIASRSLCLHLAALMDGNNLRYVQLRRDPPGAHELVMLSKASHTSPAGKAL